ncbi:CoA pyrophosphatase [Caulobacter sp. S45]|uniref:NUDIX hydrolase n=1 Tax=Caulobacter sp. S45 TaxID=1641861 RepID=UPI0020C6153A|nr:CoA pyrophosphatase [Caulobacter sp. S45]
MNAPLTAAYAAATPGSPAEVLEPWIAARLHPLSSAPVSGARTRFDLDAAGDAIPEALAATVPAAVLIALVEREDGLNLILTRRADTLSRHSGQVALPGGRTEPGEAAWTAALREAEEEIGLQPRFVRTIGLCDTYRTGTGFEITPVVAFVAAGFTLTPSAAEVAEVFETPFTFLMNPANHEERVWNSPQGARRYYAMPHQDRLIWGATAGILRALWERLFGEDAVSPDSPPLAAADR